jgi:DNA polymerase-3 subunit delta
MPSLPAAEVRRQIARRTPDPVYLITGDDGVEMSRLAGDIAGLVEDGLRAFNVERLYANEKGVTPAAIAESARILPMMADRRVVVVLRAERILKPKRRAKADAEEGEEPSDGTEALEAYVKNPVPETTLVLVAEDVDRSRKLYKALQKHATLVECWGLKSGARDPRRIGKWDLERIARDAAALATRSAKDAGYALDPAAARVLAARAGADITTLRGDLERLLLYVGERRTISVRDVQDTASGETLQDEWAVADAIQRRDAAGALRQLALAFDAGGVSYQILGQLAYVVREKLVDARRVPAAVDALFRTDLDLKTSGGDPRVLLERLVVELCRG